MVATDPYQKANTAPDYRNVKNLSYLARAIATDFIVVKFRVPRFVSDRRLAMKEETFFQKG